MYSPVGRGGIVNEWGGNDGASNFASSSSRVRRGRRNSGRANNLMQQQPMFQASRGNMYSPVGRGGIVSEWGGNDGTSNFASSSTRVRRGRGNSGRANKSMQQQPKKEESEKNTDVKKLENELRVMREDKEVMERKFGQMEELLKIKEGELATAVAENNKFKVEKDFEVQFDKSWKESYETQIKNLKAELETLQDKVEPVSAMEKSTNNKKSPIVKKKLASALKKFVSVKKKIGLSQKKSPIAKKKLADAMKKLICVEKNEPKPKQAMIKCNTCDLMFKTTGLLRRHTRLKHSSVLTNNKKAGDDFGDDATVITAVEIDTQ